MMGVRRRRRRPRPAASALFCYASSSSVLSPTRFAPLIELSATPQLKTTSGTNNNKNNQWYQQKLPVLPTVMLLRRM